MDEDSKKKEKPDLAVLGMKFRFTSENQPDVKKRAEKIKEGWNFRNTRRKFIEELSVVTLKDGSKKDFWHEAIKQIHSELLASKNISPSKKIELMLKLQELTPREDVMNINPEIDGFEISFAEPEKQKLSSNDKNDDNLDSDIESQNSPSDGDKDKNV